MKFNIHKNQRIKYSVAIKVSIFSGLIIFILLTFASVVMLKYQSNLVSYIMEQHLEKFDKVIDEQGNRAYLAMEERLKVDTDIFSSLCGISLYNFDIIGLEKTLRLYSFLPDIKAIQVFDDLQKPFLAMWKSPEVNINRSLPDNETLDNKLVFEAKAFYAEAVVGSVKIYYTDSQLVEQLAHSKQMASDEIQLFSVIVYDSIHRITIYQALSVGVILILLITSIAVCLRLFLVKPLSVVIKSLMDSTKQLSATSDDVSGSSNSLARDSAELAGSVEQTSGSLEQIGSMSRESTELTQGISELIHENIEKSGHSLKSLVSITEEISKIESDSNRIGQIVKTIDAIAFQTNLLALNAAVEAARAGEYGAGFSVVAEEVRRLAQHAAHSAQNTQDILDSTVNRVSQVALSIKELNKDFEGIIESATVMGERASAIANASSDIFSGVKQINEAEKQIGLTVQKVAISSHQSANIANQLLIQAEQTRIIVNQLLGLIGDNNLPHKGGDLRLIS